MERPMVGFGIGDVAPSHSATSVSQLVGYLVTYIVGFWANA
jgi:hypothetical protein